MDIFKTIATRRSTRKFTERQISDADLQTILKAGWAAPIGHSAYNKMQLNVIQDKDVLEKLDVHCTAAWGNPNYHMFYQAPTLIVVSGYTAEDEDVRIADTGCVMENMHLAATALGLGSIYLWAMVRRIPQDPEFIKLLGLPEGFAPLSVLAVGYPETPWPERNLDEIPENRIPTRILK